MKAQELESIYRNFYPKVYQTCFQYAKDSDDAQDWSHDIMLKIAESFSGFAGRSSVSTWIFSITRNYCITQLKRKGRIHFSELTAQLNVCSDSDEADELNERAARENREVELYDYMASLSNAEKRFLELKYFQNYSIKALQEEFGMSASAVKMRLLRARHRAGQLIDSKPAA